MLDLGSQPAADVFPLPSDTGPDAVYPLAMVQCTRCRLIQLHVDETIPDEPRGLEPAALVAQANDAIERLVSSGLLRTAGTVLEHPSPHGGSWLPALFGRGFRETTTGQADVVIDTFGMMHEADQRAAMRLRADQLTTDGVLLIQFHTVAAIMRNDMWNALRHGHYAYYSTPVLVAMAEEFGLSAVDAWEFDLYGGTVLVAFRREGDRRDSVDRLIEREIAAGVLDSTMVSLLQRSVKDSAAALHRYLDDSRAGGLSVAGYSAASRSVALLALAGVGRSDLPGIADASTAKIGRCLPGVRVPVISPADLIALSPDRVLLFVPDLLDEVRAALPDIELAGGRWVLLDPTPVEVAPTNVSLLPRRLS